MSALRWVQIVRAPAATLWEACATTGGLARWQADRVTGDIRPRGRVRLEWPDLGAAVELSVSRIVPKRHLVLSNGPAQVIHAIEDGSVTLSHEGPTENEDLEGLSSSWRAALAVLAHSVEHHPGVDRAVQWSVYPVRTSALTAHALITDPAGLAEWLGKSEGIGPTGSPWSVAIRNRTISGRVLANVPGHDVVLSWDDHGGVVVLRTLPSPSAPGARLLALQTSRWHGSGGADGLWHRAAKRLATTLRKGGVS